MHEALPAVLSTVATRINLDYVAYANEMLQFPCECAAFDDSSLSVVMFPIFESLEIIHSVNKHDLPLPFFGLATIKADTPHAHRSRPVDRRIDSRLRSGDARA